MKYSRLSLLVLLVFILQNCGNKDQVDTQVSINTIEIRKDFLFENSPELQIEILDTIDLEIPGNPPLTAIQDITFSDNFFLLLDRKHGLLKFGNSGNFLQKLGESGEGPEEYIMPYAIHLDEKEKIVLVADWQKRIVISYDSEGIFLFSSERLPGHPISFYKDNDTLFVVQETLDGTKDNPRQVFLSSIEPKTLAVKNREKSLYGYFSNFTSIHPIPRILSRVKSANLFYLPIIRGDISSHNDMDTIFRKEEGHLVPEYLLNFTGFDNTLQLGISHVVMSDSYAFLRVVYENRPFHVVIDLESKRPLIYLRKLFDQEMTDEMIPKPLNGDVFYSILRENENAIEKNPLIVMYRLTSPKN